jgi:hypothetical protein
MLHQAYLRPQVLDGNLHILVRIFLLQESRKRLLHLNEELPRLSRCLICPMLSAPALTAYPTYL